MTGVGDLLQRIFARVTRREDGCWTWSGSCPGGPRGRYGVIMVGGKVRNVRRTLYALLRGEPGDRKLVANCQTKGCVNPDHLELTDVTKGGRRAES